MTPLLPGSECLHLDQVTASSHDITMVLRTTALSALCPVCAHPSRRVHSRYPRTLADLPWQGVTVRWVLQIRRFRCTQPNCPRSIFAERLPTVVAPHARRTRRLQEILHRLGLALGGEAGARLSALLSMAVSPDTLLRLIRQVPGPAYPTPRVLGVDDWAWKKGQRYGTLLCDLERSDPVDLLPDRQAESLEAWLRAHPGVEIIARDRAGAYADGARQGAPQAIQVADRWHLLRNLSEALEGFLKRKQRYLSQAAEAIQRTDTGPSGENSEQTSAVGSDPLPSRPTTRVEQRRQEQRRRQQARFTEVRTLHQQGVSIRTLAKKFRMHRRTIRLLLRSDTLPERAPSPPRRSQLDRFRPYLRERWKAGCHNGTQLWQEIRAQGFQGSRGLLAKWVARWRREEGSTAGLSPGAVKTGALCSVPSPSVRYSAWMLLRPEADRDPKEQAYCERLFQLCPEIHRAAVLSQEFHQMVRERKAERLEAWLEAAASSTVFELHSLVAGLRRDQSAVMAALSLPWSTGPVEGHIHRLKLIKRQMYGRAKFDLLRQRVLQAA